MREQSLLDKILTEIDVSIRTLLPPPKRQGKRPTPGQQLQEASLSLSQKKHVAGLMRVNHSGEVCAQALYQGQALSAKLDSLKKQMNNAAAEETDHLAWCEERLQTLGSSPSLLNPFWYAGSLMIGVLAGFISTRFSLGFVVETEKQVSQHLQNHLQHLPPDDEKTRAILEQMHEDETHHALIATNAGAAELPEWIKGLMHYVAKLMTKTSYYV